MVACRLRKSPHCYSPFLVKSLSISTSGSTLPADFGRTTCFPGNVKKSIRDFTLRGHIDLDVDPSGVFDLMRAPVRESRSVHNDRIRNLQYNHKEPICSTIFSDDDSHARRVAVGLPCLSVCHMQTLCSCVNIFCFPSSRPTCVDHRWWARHENLWLMTPEIGIRTRCDFSQTVTYGLLVH